MHSGGQLHLSSVQVQLSPHLQLTHSGDPTYITSYKDARIKIRTIERDELLEKMVKNYIGLED